uniref:Uncharacterized protein n=1 Tax=Anguilla anguilla TaxID=7936 RepID=A0A0E9WYH1_ANGAN
MSYDCSTPPKTWELTEQTIQRRTINIIQTLVPLKNIFGDLWSVVYTNRRST